LALFLYIPFNGLVSLYVVSLVFGLSQGGIVPSYAIIVREYMPAEEAGKRIGILMVATVGGMALGGWISGLIYDLTGSYRTAFLHGIVWNISNVAIMVFILLKSRPARPRGNAMAAA
jgi:MFS family permease